MPFSFALYNFDAYLLLSYITDKLFLSYYVEATFLLSSFNLKKTNLWDTFPGYTRYLDIVC